ncbi:Mitochondrial dimethyladenosine transferase 1 [Orchesella cincta]|uniref:rRNA adenine N(6)-methyltransferase n=1 Tax=Orchesella cincta TaxID=48709 RepID=A0A1D2ML59_ORCCI|nr:Mitochondrial dimethyladenosine transferase 1 [Orchesella cincta]
MATQTALYLQQLRRQRFPPLPSVRDLVKMYQLTAIKQLSQNFLLDQKLTSKIAKAAGNIENCVVVEVGPGPGGITRSILERRPLKVIVIEKDKRFESTLRILQDACPEKLDVFWGDVLSFEMSEIIPQEHASPWEGYLPKVHIIGNLPFNISTPLISRWLSNISDKKNAWAHGRVPLTLTFQKEVAERLTADTSNEQRSRLSIMAQYLTHCEIKFIIKGSSFVPKPDVDVGVVKFIPRKEPLIRQPYKLVEKVVKQTFCMRGKYCCRPVSTLFPNIVRQSFTKMLFDSALVYPNTRPYDLAIEDFQRLCDAYAEIIEAYPEIGKYEYRSVKADTQWENEYAAKFESFQLPENEIPKRASKMKPLNVVSGELALSCEEELKQEALDNEDDIYIR